MLDMGFIPDVRRIVRATPRREQRQTLFFSATMNDDVKRLSDQWMPDPVMVDIEPEQVAVDTVKQLVYIVTSTDKFKVLYNILKLDHVGRVLVFANRRVTTEQLARELQTRGIDCELLSGAVNQNKRMRVLDDFKSGKVSVVVATDVAGRGLHVAGIDHVVNFDFPYEPDDYVHRIGRTGRAGVSGTAISFACEDESFIIPDIEEYIGEELTCRIPEEILLKEPPHPFRKHTIKTDSTSGLRRGGGGGRPGGSRGRSSGGRRSSGSGRPAGNARRSGTRHH
jgi:ATP-dependent RNA helicase RhlB